MCGRIIQASGPLRFAIVDGLNVVDSRYANMPPRYNGAPSHDMLVIRQNHETGERSLDPLKWGLIPYWCKDPKGTEWDGPLPSSLGKIPDPRHRAEAETLIARAR